LTAAAKGGPPNAFVPGTSDFYRAMSLFRQGKADEARTVATAAAAMMKPLPADDQNPLAGGPNHDELILWLAYKEAKAMIDSTGRRRRSKPGNGHPPRPADDATGTWRIRQAGADGVTARRVADVSAEPLRSCNVLLVEDHADTQFGMGARRGDGLLHLGSH
jgi:hypothetical protein